MQDLNHKQRFELYRDDEVLRKSEQYSKWTIASLMADIANIQTSGQVPLERDFQEMGALLVNNLSAKLASLLFPASRPFFKTTLSEDMMARSEQMGHKKNEIAAALARMEMDACQQLFKNASYNQLVIALKHLIVNGNVLLHRDSVKKKTTAYSLQTFTLRRDGQGQMVDCVLREQTFYGALEPKLQKLLRSKDPSKYNEQAVRRPDAVIVNLYTRIVRKFNKDGSAGYVVSQEAEDIPVGKPGYYPEHLCPWQAPTWNLIAGEHYARGMVEDYAGGFAKLSDLSHALTLYEIEACKVVNLVAPGTGTDIDTLQSAETGEYVSGTPDSVNSHETGSTEKVKAIREDIEALFGRLARAFMYTGNTRDAERVTAYEIRQDALEAENVLGGTYSSLAEGLQVPMAHVLMIEVNPGILAGIVTQEVKLDVMAGIPALGRSVDVQNLLAAAQEIAGITPNVVQFDNRIDPNKVNDLIYAGRSVDTSMLFKSEDQLAEEAEAAEAEAQGMAQMQGAGAMAEQQDVLNQLQVQ